MKKLLSILSIVCMLFLAGCAATNIQPAPNKGPVKFGGVDSLSIVSGQPNVYNITVTSSPVLVIPKDGTNLDWLMFSEDNNVRCLPQYYGTLTNTPSSSVGWLLIGQAAALNSNNLTDPTYEWDCAATGSTAHISLIIDKRIN